MWPLKKKSPIPMEQLPLGGPWTLMQGDYQGKVMFIRINAGYKDYGSIPGYEEKVSIVVPFMKPDPRGLPVAEEDETLAELEERMAQLFEQAAESLYVIAITTSGMREFVLYTRNLDGARGKFRQISKGLKTHQMHFNPYPDPDWAIYQQFSPDS